MLLVHEQRRLPRVKPTARTGMRVTVTLEQHGPLCGRTHGSAVRVLGPPLVASLADLEDVVWRGVAG